MPNPRTYSGPYSSRPIITTVSPDKTWIEPEEFTYPSGGWGRRAFARCPDGVIRLMTCSIADNAFAIPARFSLNGKQVKGYLRGGTDGGVIFMPYNSYADRFEKKPGKDATITTPR